MNKQLIDIDTYSSIGINCNLKNTLYSESKIK